MAERGRSRSTRVRNVVKVGPAPHGTTGGPAAHQNEHRALLAPNSSVAPLPSLRSHLVRYPPLSSPPPSINRCTLLVGIRYVLKRWIRCRRFDRLLLPRSVPFCGHSSTSFSVHCVLCYVLMVWMANSVRFLRHLEWTGPPAKTASPPKVFSRCHFVGLLPHLRCRQSPGTWAARINRLVYHSYFTFAWHRIAKEVGNSTPKSSKKSSHHFTRNKPLEQEGVFRAAAIAPPLLSPATLSRLLLH